MLLATRGRIVHTHITAVSGTVGENRMERRGNVSDANRRLSIENVYAVVCTTYMLLAHFKVLWFRRLTLRLNKHILYLNASKASANNMLWMLLSVEA